MDIRDDLSNTESAVKTDAELTMKHLKEEQEKLGPEEAKFAEDVRLGIATARSEWPIFVTVTAMGLLIGFLLGHFVR